MEELFEKSCAVNYRDVLNSEKDFAQRRSSELADEFTRLEVQVAAILIAFAGVFLNYFEQGVADLLSSTIFVIKVTYASSVFFLISSLALGLIHLKRKEKFWDEVMNAKFVAYKKWRLAVQGETTYQEALAYQNGTAQERGNIVHSPLWTWALQTIFLGIAFVLFFILFLVFLFS